MSCVAIELTSVSKRYRLGEIGWQSWWRSLLNRHRNNVTPQYIWALRDVNLQVRQGEKVGIIGKNGAGKSTLLKLISRITYPTSGTIVVRGRVGSILEVGTGFHPDLTGRENIYMNGLILGMKKKEIDSKLDEIVAFAGPQVEQFLDTPIKRYSSGMYMRLAFAVAAHLNTQILLVDEVLAVGDIEFQRKCLGKMEKISEEGKTVLFVSHNMGAILGICDRAILLERGRIIEDNSPEEVVRKYLSTDTPQKCSVTLEKPDFDSEAILKQISVYDANMTPTTQIDFRFPFYISIDFEVLRPVGNLSLWIRLTNQHGIYALFSWLIFQENYAPGLYRALAELPGSLLSPGQYFIDAGTSIYRVRPLHFALRCISFEILSTTPTYNPSESGWGVIHPTLKCKISPLPYNVIYG